MERFEKHWKEVRFEVPKAAHPLQAWEYYSHTASYDISKDIWREAFETIRKEINSANAPSIFELLMFIGKELDE